MIVDVVINAELMLDYHITNEKNRGRTEKRTVEVYPVSEEIKKNYPHCNTLIRIMREREAKGRSSKEVFYYISDLNHSAEEFSVGIRGHWAIENSLHYVKDKVMIEDKANLKNKLIAPNISLLRSFVITIAYLFDKSVTNFQRTFAHNLNLLLIL